MDLLLIVRDALASSLVGTLLVALQAREAGRAVGVLITQEALAAIAGGCLEWPRELSGHRLRLTIADRGGATGIPLLGRGEGRQLDPKSLMSQARQAGVKLYACPIWTSLLDLKGKIPEGLEAIDAVGLPDLIQDAKQIVGTL